MLKKENYSVKDELKKSESEVKKLKKEKLALLDKLVVFEGLVESKGFVEHSDAESHTWNSLPEYHNSGRSNDTFSWNQYGKDLWDTMYWFGWKVIAAPFYGSRQEYFSPCS